MPKRSFEVRRRETNRRYYENKKADQAQQPQDDQDGEVDSSFFES